MDKAELFEENVRGGRQLHILGTGVLEYLEKWSIIASFFSTLGLEKIVKLDNGIADGGLNIQK